MPPHSTFSPALLCAHTHQQAFNYAFAKLFTASLPSLSCLRLKKVHLKENELARLYPLPGKKKKKKKKDKKEKKKKGKEGKKKKKKKSYSSSSKATRGKKGAASGNTASSKKKTKSTALVPLPNTQRVPARKAREEEEEEERVETRFAGPLYRLKTLVLSHTYGVRLPTHPPTHLSIHPLTHSPTHSRSSRRSSSLLGSTAWRTTGADCGPWSSATCPKRNSSST